MERSKLSLLEPRVQLDLVDRGDDVGLVEEALKVRRIWKFDTPMLRTRPSAYNLSKARQVST